MIPARRAIRALACTTAGLLLAGCPQTPGSGGGDQKAALKPFASPDELISYFRQQARQRSSSRFGLDLFAAEPASANAEDDASGGAGDSQSFSTTNIQEAGVDEGDYVKNDGEYFYIASGQSLRIVRAEPGAELAQVGRLDLDISISEIYLQGDSVLLLGQRIGAGGGVDIGAPEILIWPPYYIGSDVEVVQVSVADRASPAIVNRVTLDGSLVSSRLTNGRLVVVVTIAPELPTPANVFTLGSVTLDNILPRMSVNGAAEVAVDWSETLRPASPDGYYMTAAITLDATDITQKLASVAILAGAGTIYSSTDALYVTDTAYDENDSFRETTAIHKFRYDEQGAARYVASGSVKGRLLNQFSLGEKDGFLRVATYVQDATRFIAADTASSPDTPVSSPGTAQDLDAEAPSNSVYVLAEVDGQLVVQGSVEGIAPSERIYSARFMGDRGFLVTFRQIDPLFTLDLADPAAPRVLGELKVPGYSEYLHPWGDDRLIGVGRAVAVTPWGGVVPDALQLSLFDVSDFANPVLVDQMEIGGMGSWWEVSSTHKAFTFLPETGVLALPASLYDGDFFGGRELASGTFEGVICFQLDPASGFSEIGRISTAAAANGSPDEPFYGYSLWKRAAINGQTVFALTPSVVRSAPLGEFENTHAVELAP